ncbi:MAG: hypothetical protein K5764_03045 [Prevotella sp.]|nr:hypothetical protein [Prevotella sp.]
MSWRLTYRCAHCGYSTYVYEGRGLFRQEITPVVCSDCHSVQNLTTGGIIADVAPSYSSLVGRLCPNCGSDRIAMWNLHTCPRCGGRMEPTGEKEYWT